jgi:PPOX class probable F420-dependent enzyme
MPLIPESHRDLLDADVATLATISPDGRPQLTEVWFLKNDQDEERPVAISLNTARQKTKNLRHDPKCALFVLDLAVPQRYLEIRGDAEIEADDDYHFADRIGEKYGANLRAFDPPEETRVVVRIRAQRINAVDMRRR